MTIDLFVTDPLFQRRVAAVKANKHCQPSLACHGAAFAGEDPRYNSCESLHLHHHNRITDERMTRYFMRLAKPDRLNGCSKIVSS